MNTKVVAAGFIAVIVIAAAVGGVALVSQHDDDKPKDDGASIIGKWSVMYIEAAKTSNESGAITNYEDVVITSHTFNPKDDKIVLEFLSTNNMFFKGKADGNDISGTFDGITFKYENVMISKHDSKPHMFTVNGVFKGDYISISFNQYDLTKDDMKLCYAGYALLIPENGDTVSPRIDWLDYNLPIQHRSTTLHIIDDFKTGGNPHGTSLPNSSLNYKRTHNLLNLYEMTGAKGGEGVMILASLGYDDHGNAYGIVSGNLISGSSLGSYNTAFLGTSTMSNGEWKFSPHFVSSEDSVRLDYVFNVPYYHGKTYAPSFLEKSYKGTVTQWNPDGKKVTGNITKEFSMSDDTFYGYESAPDGSVYEWLGQIKSDGKQLSIFVSSTKFTGSIHGTINDDGTLTMYGFLRNQSQNVVVIYELTPIK